MRLLVVPLVLLLGGACSDGDSARNQADITFVAGMIPHHAQAVVMSGYADGRAARAEVKKVAAEIAATQDPEIDQMESLLDDWDAARPASGAAGGHSGVLSDRQLQALEASEGEAFDRLFAEQMIRHHQGAVTAARDELADGESENARELAQAIIDRQNKQITELEKILTGT